MPNAAKPRDFCGHCRELCDIEDMHTYEGDRYCKSCGEQIEAEAAEFYGRAS